MYGSRGLGLGLGSNPASGLRPAIFRDRLGRREPSGSWRLPGNQRHPLVSLLPHFAVSDLPAINTNSNLWMRKAVWLNAPRLRAACTHNQNVRSVLCQNTIPSMMIHLL